MNFDKIKHIETTDKKFTNFKLFDSLIVMQKCE